jgi:hypothetical protein
MQYLSLINILCLFYCIKQVVQYNYFVVPTATGMALTLCMLALKRKRPKVGGMLIFWDFLALFNLKCLQCCGSGSAFILVVWIWIRIRIGNPDPDSGGPKLTTKVETIQVLNCYCRCSHLRDEDFSYSLDVLYVGLGISKLQFLIK